MALLITQRANVETDRYILIAKMDNVKNLSTILKAVCIQESATVFLSESGIKVTVESSKCVQASAFVQAALFQQYIFTEEKATFRINLTVLMECLNIFSSSKESTSFTALRMNYAGYGSPLILLLEEGGVITECSIQTENPDETLDFNFCSSNVTNKMILKSECLREAFSELDMTSEVLQILMSPDSPYLRLSTFGNAGSTHVDYPKDSDMVESFECTQTQSFRYKITLLKPSTKALMLSSKISIRMDDRGFLSLQYMMLNEDGQICFVEYLCSPDEEAEDSDTG